MSVVNDSIDDCDEVPRNANIQLQARKRQVRHTSEHIYGVLQAALVETTAPNLCVRMRMQRAKSQTQELFILEKRLRAALREEPPPTVREIYDRLGTKRWVVRNHFPELNNALGSRSRQFRCPRHEA
jgi:hypothetical protein